MKIYAGILAGGTGSRMGAGVPKQFVELQGKAVLLHTLECFVGLQEFERIYVAVVESHMDLARRIIAEGLSDSSRVEVIAGGSDRNGSLLNVIDRIGRREGGNDALLVSHDAARPFVSERIIREGIEAAIATGASNTMIPAVDTPVRSEDGQLVSAIPERAGLYNTQTPQTFRIRDFLSACEQMDEDARSRATDACKVLLSAGIPIAVVQGDPRNIKLTTPFDMLVAQAIVSEKE